MQANIPAQIAVPGLLCTQLMAAEVYSYFLHVSSEGEKELWKRLLREELEHVDHLRRVFMDNLAQGVLLPEVNVLRMREIRDQVLALGCDMFLLRLEGALRLECAELDYGLEGLAARRLRKKHYPFDFPGDIAEHVKGLIHEATRYAESRNIGLLTTRLKELLETSLSETSLLIRKEDSWVNPRDMGL